MQDVIHAAAIGLPVLLLAALATRDVRDGALPDTLLALFAMVSLGIHLSGLQPASFAHGLVPEQSLLGAALGGGVLLALRHGARDIWKQDVLKSDYVKLTAAGGLLLGAPHIMVALALAAGFGMVHSLVIWRQEPAGVTLGKINVPAGLGLGLGIAIVWLMQNGFLMK